MNQQGIFGSCKLCGEDAQLRESHIIPAFVFRWLKTRSGTNRHIRNTERPNVRVQDGIKEYWLCQECETRFSKDETAFAKKVFHPFVSGEGVVTYQDFMLRFCTSVSWRVLKFAFGRNSETHYSDEQLALVDQAETYWRKFLLGKRPHPGKFEQHALAWGLISETTVPDLPTNMNRFVTGPITLDIVGSDATLMSFAKLGPIMIFGHIQVRKRSWVGSKIAVEGGRFPVRKYVLPPGLIPLFQEKASLIEEGWSKLSAKQTQIIQESIEQHGEDFLSTPQGKAIIADADMFGVDAVTPKNS